MAKIREHFLFIGGRWWIRFCRLICFDSSPERFINFTGEQWRCARRNCSSFSSSWGDSGAERQIYLYLWTEKMWYWETQGPRFTRRGPLNIPVGYLLTLKILSSAGRRRGRKSFLLVFRFRYGKRGSRQILNLRAITKALFFEQNMLRVNNFFLNKQLLSFRFLFDSNVPNVFFSKLVSL